MSLNNNQFASPLAFKDLRLNIALFFRSYFQN